MIGVSKCSLANVGGVLYQADPRMDMLMYVPPLEDFPLPGASFVQCIF